MTLRVWLVRHGESTWNAEGRLQGWADPPLTDVGRWQAGRVAEKLSRVPLLALYTSPLQRALDTASAIGAAVGLEPLCDERLKEVGVGEATGVNWEEITTRWPHLEVLAQRGEFVVPHIPGAESVASFCGRVADFAAMLCAQHAEGDVAVVSHGGTLRAYLGRLLGIPDGAYVGLRFGNASISRVRYRAAGRVDVTLLNDRCHLEDGREV